MSSIPIIFGAVGIAIILIVYLPYLAEKKRQEEHQREIEEAIKRHDEWTLVELRANLMALESEMMREELDISTEVKKMRLIDANEVNIPKWEKKEKKDEVD